MCIDFWLMSAPRPCNPPRANQFTTDNCSVNTYAALQIYQGFSLLFADLTPLEIVVQQTVRNNSERISLLCKLSRSLVVSFIFIGDHTSAERGVALFLTIL
jgi:hypothetical protein